MTPLALGIIAILSILLICAVSAIIWFGLKWRNIL